MLLNIYKKLIYIYLILIHTYLLLLYDSSITHIEHSPNYIAFGLQENPEVRE